MNRSRLYVVLLLAGIAGLQACASLDKEKPAVQAASATPDAKLAAKAEAKDLLQNGALHKVTDPWWAAGATFKIEDGMGCAKFDKPGSNPWDVILGQSGLSLKKGAAYTLSFKLRADTASKLRVVVQHDGPPWTAAFAQESLPIGPEAKSHEFKFSPAADDAKVTFQFQMGAAGANRVCLSDVSLVGPVAK